MFYLLVSNLAYDIFLFLFPSYDQTVLIITNTLQEKRRNVDVFGVINEM